MPAMAVILLSVAMSSCGIYSSYTRPESCQATDSLIRRDVAYIDTTTLSPAAWEEYFDDAHLRTLIARALEHNTDLNIARRQVEEAKAVMQKNRLAFLPSADLTAEGGASRYNGVSKETYNIGVEASWEIDIFGKQRNALRGAMAALEEREAYRQAVQTELIATVAESYYQLLMLDCQEAITEQTLELWGKTVTMLEALADAGRSDDVAVRQAKASRYALEASLETIRRQIIETESIISNLTKFPATHVDRGSLETQTLGSEISKGVSLQALATRPDVKEAEGALAEAFYGVNSAKSAFYPSLTLSGTIGWTNNGGGSIVNPGKWLLSALGQLTAPLFDRGTKMANLKVARLQQEEATLRFEQVLLEAGNEVNDAITAWQAADRRIGYDRLQIEELREAVSRTELLVQYTSANYLEVLTAEKSLLNAELTEAEDMAARIIAAIRLYRALGGGVN
ncbi:MAG: efflux transporter outer membrane subunit [Lepagella sp.]